MEKAGEGLSYHGLRLGTSSPLPYTPACRFTPAPLYDVSPYRIPPWREGPAMTLTLFSIHLSYYYSFFSFPLCFLTLLPLGPWEGSATYTTLPVSIYSGNNTLFSELSYMSPGILPAP